MRLYNALIKRNSEEKIEDVILLKEGFSLLALCFGPLWFLSRKMWNEFFIIIAFNATFAFFTNIFSKSDKILIEILFAFIIAVNANYWFGEHLRKKNYQFIGLIFGSSKSNAQLNFAQSFQTNSQNDINEFGDAILNPKFHRQAMKLKKQTGFD
jgi:hypothetical protein